MVRLAFAAINASPDTDGEEQNGETLEAQEARVADSYMRALQLVQDGRTTEAQVRSVFLILLTHSWSPIK